MTKAMSASEQAESRPEERIAGSAEPVPDGPAEAGRSPGIRAQLLGDFSLACADAAVGDGNSRSHKVKSLLAYLVYNRDRMVSIDELIRILGNDRRDSAPIAALRTTLYRVRRAIEPIEQLAGAPLVVTQNGMYGWNPRVPVELDTARLEKLCLGEAPEGPGRVDYYQSILELYRGDFLQNLASEHWVEPLAEHYRSLYLSAVQRAAPVFMEEGLLRETVDHCWRAISLSPYCEPLYRWLMRARSALGDSRGAAEVYEQLRTLLYKDLGVMPEEETQQVYQQILLDAGGGALTPDSIRGQLQEHEPPAGALMCDYTSFKLFYQAEARAAARRGDAIHIGVLSVLSRNGKPLSAHSLSRAMGQLHSQICKSLRTGDIASCCSSSQYILMLVQANYENSRLVCERVVRDFLREHPRSPIRIQSVVFPLEPMFTNQDTGRRQAW